MPDVPATYNLDRPIDSNIGTTINIDFSADLTQDHESEVPLLTLLNKLKDEKTLTNTFKFAIGRFAPRTSTVNGATAEAAAANDTKVVAAANGGYFVEYDLLQVADGAGVEDATRTSIVYIISGGVSGNNLSVKPYDPTKKVAAFADGATIRKIGSTMPESGSGRNSFQTVPTVYEQYTHTFEDYYKVSRIQATNRQYTDPERTRLREEARKKHALDQEYAAYFSKKAKDTTTDSAKPRYMMDGLDAMISTNSLSYGASLSDAELYDFMTKVHNPMYSGGMKRIVLCSGDLLASVNKLATPAIRIDTKESTWGPNITDVQFAGRRWSFVEAPALSEARPGWGYVIHPMFLKKRTFWPTTFEMNVQNPIDKFYKDGFYSVWGLELRLEEVFGVIKP